MFQVGVQNIALQHQVREFAVADDRNQPGRFQLFEVVRERGGGYGLALADIRTGNAFIFGTNLFQNLMAARIGQRFRNPAYLLLWKLFRQGGQLGSASLFYRAGGCG